MRLYSGTSASLIQDSTRNRIAAKLEESFFHHFRYRPSPAEVNSWRQSLRAFSQVIQEAELINNGVLLEYQLPLTSRRLDCLLTGTDAYVKAQAVIVELKQWDRCEKAAGSNEVTTWVGGAMRDVLHPSVQVGQYRAYLQDSHTAFHEEADLGLSACAYLHNYSYDPKDEIFSRKFSNALTSSPIFTADDVDTLITYLRGKLLGGDTGDVLKAIENSQYRPSRKLLQHVGETIRGRSEYTLLDDQLVVFDRVLAIAEEGFRGRRKSVVIVKGGPGTGKSVIALNLLGELSSRNLNTHYVTGSRAFTTTVREIVGSRAAQQIKYFNSYSGAQYNEIDIMVCDEAHRIRLTSNSRFTPSTRRSDLPQIGELMKASKASVFFIDDNQIVRPGEVGSVQYIKDAAAKGDCDLFEYELEAQFRCSGSEAFVNWIDNTLQVRKTANILWTPAEEEFDFRIFGTPGELETAIIAKIEAGSTGRLTAGFCWPWSKPKADGTLVADVVIGNYVRPWNARSDAGRLAAGVPAENLWAYREEGIAQIGCVYTAQGFEFDYIGVIIGLDLIFDPDSSEWVGHPGVSFDTVVKRSKDSFTANVKNTYRVLLTRGMKGCYVCFLDENTKNFFRSRIDF